MLCVQPALQLVPLVAILHIQRNNAYWQILPQATLLPACFMLRQSNAMRKVSGSISEPFTNKGNLLGLQLMRLIASRNGVMTSDQPSKSSGGSEIASQMYPLSVSQRQLPPKFGRMWSLPLDYP